MTKIKTTSLLILVFGLVLTDLSKASSPALRISPVNQEEPTRIKAKSITHEQELGLIVARGDVRIYHDSRILRADVVTYHQQTDVITASGNVSLTQESGETLFADYMEITGDLKNALIEQMRVLLNDDSKFAAVRGVEKNGREVDLEYGVYSPCNVCKEHPEKSPLWQIKAHAIHWDQETHDIEYTDAFMEFMGVPFMYAPYFHHPDPTVKRRSGLLAPTFEASRQLGAVAIIPYFYVISPDKDMTLAPVLTSKAGLFLAGDYRQRFGAGMTQLGGSFGQSELITGHKNNQRERKRRGHFVSDTRYNLNEDWRSRLKIARASDQTYLREFPFYGLETQSILISQGQFEGFHGRSYASINAYSFQGLRQNDRDSTTPLILPLVDYNYLSDPSPTGRISLDANALALSRHRGDDMRRLSLKGGWQLPTTTAWGDQYTVGASLRGDGYHFKERPPLSRQRAEKSVGRLFTQAYLQWQYPWINRQGEYRWYLEPQAGIIGAPKIARNKRIPDEDTLIFELDDHNLMLDKRIAGLDRLEDGSRAYYGVTLGGLSSYYGRGEFFFGQSYDFEESTPFFRQAGVNNQWSDYVGRARYTFDPYFSAYYRFRLSRARVHPYRSELGANLGPPSLRLFVDYLELPLAPGEDSRQSDEQIRVGASVALNEQWTATGAITRNLGSKSKAKTLLQEAGLLYKDECFSSQFTLTRTFYRDRDIRPGVTVMMRLIFKNLGEFRQRQAFSSNQSMGTTPNLQP